jgi:hypothetical protein
MVTSNWPASTWSPSRTKIFSMIPVAAIPSCIAAEGEAARDGVCAQAKPGESSASVAAAAVKLFDLKLVIKKTLPGSVHQRLARQFRQRAIYWNLHALPKVYCRRQEYSSEETIATA